MRRPEVMYPAMRVELIETLVDPIHQRRRWVDEPDSRRGTIETFEQNLTTNVDGLGDLAPDPFGAVGAILLDGDEARAVASFTRVLDSFYDDLPLGPDDGAVIARPEWPGVVAAARETLTQVGVAS